MGTPKKITDKNIPKNSDAEEDDDDDSLDSVPRKKVVDDDEDDFDGPLDDLGFEDFGDDAYSEIEMTLQSFVDDNIIEEDEMQYVNSELAKITA